MRLRFALFALAWAACTTIDVDRLSAPILPEGSRGMILVVAREGIASEAWVFDRGSPQVLSLPPSGDFELYAIALDCDPGGLGLREGPLEMTAEGRGFPPHSASFASTWSGGVQSAWSEIELPPSIAALRFRFLMNAPEVCAIFTPSLATRDILLEGTRGTNPNFALALDASSALVVTATGQFFRVDDRSATLLALPPETPHAGGFIRADGELWLIGDLGEVVHGRLESGFVPAPSLVPTGEAIHQAVSGSPDGPIELFAMSGSGVFQHFDGTSWTILDSSAAEGEPAIDVAWLGPGRAIALIANPNRILHVDGGRVVVGELAGTQREAPASFGLVPQGTLIGTNLGGILFDRPGGQDVFPGSPFEDSVHAFRAYGDGFFVTGGPGLGAFYHPRAGFCRLEKYAVKDIKPVLPIADGLLLVSRAVDLGEPVVLVHVRPEVEPACGASP